MGVWFYVCVTCCVCQYISVHGVYGGVYVCIYIRMGVFCVRMFLFMYACVHDLLLCCMCVCVYEYVCVHIHVCMVVCVVV